MKLLKLIILASLLLQSALSSATNYTVSNATDLKSKLTTIVAGDTLFVASGNYALSASITLTKNGTSSSKICVMAANMSNRPVLDFAGTATGDCGISLRGDYWHIKGLKIANAGDNGMHLESSASYNTVEFCDFYRNEDTGLQIDNLAFNNLIKNCDSYFNADATLENADGFACKMDAGSGNTFEGCRAWRNLDDGWDGYLRDADNITTTYINCWAFRNGYNESDAAGVGDGNGFKTGGSDNKDLKHNGIYKNCIAAYNRVDGFDHNSNQGDVTLYNCLATGNTTNMGFGSTNPVNKLTIKNTVVIGSTGNLSATTTDISYNSWNLSVTANASDYNSILLDAMDDARGVDGSLPTNLFKIVAGSDLIDKGINVGIAYSGTAPDLGPDEYTNVSAPTLVLTSGLSTQTVTQNTAISNIVYTYGGTATGATVTGLPTGITPTTNTTNKTITISGSTAVLGTANYTITTTQTAGTAVSLTGAITVVAAPTISLTSGSATQTVVQGVTITNIVYTWGGGATGATVSGLPTGFTSSVNTTAKTITISGSSSVVVATTTYTVSTSGGGTPATLTGTITVSADPNAAAMSTSGGSLNQSVTPGVAITPITLTWAGGSTGINITNLPAGLTTSTSGKTITISGTPTATGTFTATTIGGTQTPITLTGTITVGSAATETFESLTSTILSTGSDKTQDITLNGLIWKVEKARLMTTLNQTPGGTNSIRLNYGNGVLVTPLLAGKQTFSFYVSTPKDTKTVKIEVYLSTDGGTTWGSTAIFSEDIASIAFLSKSVTINETSDVKLKICNKGGVSASSDFLCYIDDVTYTAATGTPTSCCSTKIDASVIQTSDELIVTGVEVNSIRLLSIQGSVISSSEASQSIVINQLAKGVYIAVINSKEGCFSKKILIK